MFYLDSFHERNTFFVFFFESSRCHNHDGKSKHGSCCRSFFACSLRNMRLPGVGRNCIRDPQAELWTCFAGMSPENQRFSSVFFLPFPHRSGYSPETPGSGQLYTTLTHPPPFLGAILNCTLFSCGSIVCSLVSSYTAHPAPCSLRLPGVGRNRIRDPQAELWPCFAGVSPENPRFFLLFFYRRFTAGWAV